jgi:hypothetical protein
MRNIEITGIKLARLHSSLITRVYPNVSSLIYNIIHRTLSRVAPRNIVQTMINNI